MNKQYSQKLSDILVYSKEEAGRLRCDCIGPEHLLLAILRDGSNTAVDLLNRLQTDLSNIKREIEKVYPDWLLELTLLLQTDNMHVAIEKTLADAPPVLKRDLEDLADDIMVNPNDLTPYAAFFNFLNLPSVRSSMKLLYSMAEFGSTDESLQLAELVERNHILMDKAEQYKNDDKVALVFSIKFLPTLASSLKMLVDLLIFLFSYMGAMNI